MTEDQIDEDGVYVGAERELLRDALKAMGKSARQVADRLEIGDTRLRQIVNGYQPAGRGQRIAVVAPAETLASIAMVLGISAEALEGAGRGDAADVIRAKESMAEGDPAFAELLANSDSIFSELKAWTEQLIPGLAPGSPPPTSGLFFWSTEQMLEALAERERGHRETVRWHIARYARLKARLEALQAHEATAGSQAEERARREIEQDPDYQEDEREASQAATRRRHEERQSSTAADDGERDDTAV